MMKTEKKIKMFEKMLKQYNLELEKNQNSIFYAGLVKNTKEHIEELKKIL